MNLSILYAVMITTAEIVGIVVAKKWNLNDNPTYLLVVIFLFGLVGLLFANSLKYEGMAIMNILWISFSIIITTFVGYFIFKENISLAQLVGIGIIIIGLFLVNFR
ncbi:EamA family transporter [Patescibacteria group bacterium]|nr:EamA family transporter [Patescibacteria group bacterium]